MQSMPLPSTVQESIRGGRDNLGTSYGDFGQGGYSQCLSPHPPVCVGVEGGVGRGRGEVSSCSRPISGVDITPYHLTVQ